MRERPRARDSRAGATPLLCNNFPGPGSPPVGSPSPPSVSREAPASGRNQLRAPAAHNTTRVGNTIISTFCTMF